MDIALKVNDRYIFIVFEHKGKYRIESVQRPDNDPHIIKTAPTAKEALSMIVDMCEKAGEQ